MDLQSGGELTATMHSISAPRAQHKDSDKHDGTSSNATGEIATSLPPPYLRECLNELTALYSRAYAEACGRRALDPKPDPGVGAYFRLGSSFSQILSRTAFGPLHNRFAALLYMVMVVAECHSDFHLLHQRFEQPRMLSLLMLSRSEATVQALLVAIREEELTNSYVGPYKTGVVLRCVYAYRRLTNAVQSRLDDAFLAFLIADGSGLDNVWSPRVVRELIARELG